MADPSHAPAAEAAEAATPAAPAFELKSAALSLVAVLLKTVDLAAIEREVQARVAHAPGSFDHEPVVIDLGAVREADEPIDFDALLALLRRYELLPIAAKRGSAAQMAAASAAGLSEAPDTAPAGATAARKPQDEPPQPTAGHENGRHTDVVLTEVIREVPVPVPAATTLVIDKPLRSGQQVYARGGDVVVLAAVNVGAEIIADGHVHVYAPLRGRAIAGARGDVHARIFSTCMQPQLVCIAGTYRTTEAPLPEAVLGKPAQVRLEGDTIVVEPVGA